MATKRAFLALILLLTLLVVGPLAARAATIDDQVREVAKTLRCPVCSGESVADSNAPLSVQMRGIIREKLEAGESPDQIRAYFVAHYGPEILQTPAPAGFTLGVWLMPILALLVGLAVVVTVLRSWSRPSAAQPAATAPAATLPESEEARLEAELRRFQRQGASGTGREQ